MPVRHLWWGIHDPALVHKALTVLPPGGWLTLVPTSTISPRAGICHRSHCRCSVKPGCARRAS